MLLIVVAVTRGARVVPAAGTVPGDFADSAWGPGSSSITPDRALQLTCQRNQRRRGLALARHPHRCHSSVGANTSWRSSSRLAGGSATDSHDLTSSIAHSAHRSAAAA